MTSGTAYYVYGKKYDFPWAEAWLSGPHDRDEAFETARAIRPLYPDANVSVRPRTGKTLPTVRPRRSAPGDITFDMSKASGRRAAARAIAERVERIGLVAVVEDRDGEPDVDVQTPSLRAAIWLGYTPAAPMPIISWHRAAYDLRGVPGAWLSVDINTSHRRKATTLCKSWPGLFEALEIGLLASIDGSAFDA